MILRSRAEKYMWSVHKCDHSRLGDFNTQWTLPIHILHSRSPTTSAPNSQSVWHAYTHIRAKLSPHSPQTSPHSPPCTRLLFIPPSWRRIVMRASHRTVRINCAAAEDSKLTFPLPFALSFFNLSLVTLELA